MHLIRVDGLSYTKTITDDIKSSSNAPLIISSGSEHHDESPQVSFATLTVNTPTLQLDPSTVLPNAYCVRCASYDVNDIRHFICQANAICVHNQTVIVATYFMSNRYNLPHPTPFLRLSRLELSDTKRTVTVVYEDQLTFRKHDGLGIGCQLALIDNVVFILESFGQAAIYNTLTGKKIVHYEFPKTMDRTQTNVPEMLVALQEQRVFLFLVCGILTSYHLDTNTFACQLEGFHVDQLWPDGSLTLFAQRQWLSEKMKATTSWPKIYAKIQLTHIDTPTVNGSLSTKAIGPTDIMPQLFDWPEIHFVDGSGLHRGGITADHKWAKVDATTNCLFEEQLHVRGYEHVIDRQVNEIRKQFYWKYKSVMDMVREDSRLTDDIPDAATLNPTKYVAIQTNAKLQLPTDQFVPGRHVGDEIYATVRLPDNSIVGHHMEGGRFISSIVRISNPYNKCVENRDTIWRHCVPTTAAIDPSGSRGSSPAVYCPPNFHSRTVFLGYEGAFADSVSSFLPVTIVYLILSYSIV